MKTHTIFKAVVLAAALSSVHSSEAKNGLPLSAVGKYTFTSEVSDWHGYVFSKPKGRLVISRFHKSGLKISIKSDTEKTTITLTSKGRYFVTTVADKISHQSGTWFRRAPFRQGRIFTRSKSASSSYTLKDDFGLATNLSIFILNTGKGMYHKFVASRDR